MRNDTYGTFRSSEQGQRLARKADYVEGWWENIAPQPIYIHNKKHLKQVCQKYGVIPKAFARRKSQGKGLEWTY